MDKQKVIVWSSGSEHRSNHGVITLIDQLSKISPGGTFLLLRLLFANHRGGNNFANSQTINQQNFNKEYSLNIAELFAASFKAGTLYLFDRFTKMPFLKF